jgi:hypothetical protein
MRLKITTLLVAFLIISGNYAFSQGYRPHPLLSPMWQADAEYMAPSQVVDTTFKNGFTGAAFTFRLPLYTGKDWLSADGGKPFFAILAQAGTSARQSQVDYLEPDRVLTISKIGFTGLMATGASSLRNLYMAQFTASLPTENYWLNLSYAHFHGAVLWRRLYHNNRFWHTLGIIYTPINGNDRIFPILGGGYKLGNEDQIQLTFPFNFTYTHLFTRKVSLSLKLNANGGYYYLRKDTLHTDDPLIYRLRYPKVSVMARYYTDRHVVLIPEIGLCGKSKLQLAEKKDTQLSTFYFKFSLQVRFGKRPTASPILNFDPGDSGFDPSYLVE